MVTECQNCGNTVTDDWAKVWTQDGTVHHCHDCLPDDEDHMRHLNAGAAAKPEYELISRRGHKVV